jgi:hypothetical protein
MLEIAVASGRLLNRAFLGMTGLIGHGRCGLRLTTITTMKDFLSSFNHPRTMSLVAIGFQFISTAFRPAYVATLRSPAMSRRFAASGATMDRPLTKPKCRKTMPE